MGGLVINYHAVRPMIFESGGAYVMQTLTGGNNGKKVCDSQDIFSRCFCG